jgi:hypothetical protein
MVATAAVQRTVPVGSFSRWRYGGLSQFGLTQHHHRVAIDFLASIGHPEPP